MRRWFTVPAGQRGIKLPGVCTLSAIGVWLFLIQTSGVVHMGSVTPNLTLALFLVIAIRGFPWWVALVVGSSLIGASLLWVPFFLPPVLALGGLGVAGTLLAPHLTGQRGTDIALILVFAWVLWSVVEWQASLPILTGFLRAGEGFIAVAAAVALLWFPVRAMIPER